MPKKVFITGGTGFIGRYLVEKLAKRGDEIFCLTRDLSKVSLPNYGNVQYVEGDIAKSVSYEKYLKGCDCLIHLAAVMRHTVIDRKDQYCINVQGTKEILKAALRSGVSKVIYISTAAIFHPTKDIEINENSKYPTAFINYYSYTKHLGFLEAKKFLKEGLPLITILPVSTYGEGSPLFKEFLDFLYYKKIFFRCLLSRKLSLVHVDDVVSGIILAESSAVPGDDYILSSETLTMQNLIARAEDFYKIKISIINIPYSLIKIGVNILSLISKLIKKEFFTNKELLNFIDGNLVASGEHARDKLMWRTSDFEIKFKEMLYWHKNNL